MEACYNGAEREDDDDDKKGRQLEHRQWGCQSSAVGIPEYLRCTHVCIEGAMERVLGSFVRFITGRAGVGWPGSGHWPERSNSSFLVEWEEGEWEEEGEADF